MASPHPDRVGGLPKFAKPDPTLQVTFDRYRSFLGTEESNAADGHRSEAKRAASAVPRAVLPSPLFRY